jgi:hypothetical protein
LADFRWSGPYYGVEERITYTLGSEVPASITDRRVALRQLEPLNPTPEFSHHFHPTLVIDFSAGKIAAEVVLPTPHESDRGDPTLSSAWELLKQPCILRKLDGYGGSGSSVNRGLPLQSTILLEQNGTPHKLAYPLGTDLSVTVLPPSTASTAFSWKISQIHINNYKEVALPTAAVTTLPPSVQYTLANSSIIGLAQLFRQGLLYFVDEGRSLSGR